MKLDKAIKKLENYPWGASPDYDIDFNAANLLGIEAMKHIQRQRKDLYRTEWQPLPGETEE